MDTHTLNYHRMIDNLHYRKREKIPKMSDIF